MLIFGNLTGEEQSTRPLPLLGPARGCLVSMPSPGNRMTMPARHYVEHFPVTEMLGELRMIVHI